MGTTKSRNTKAIYISPIFFERMNRRATSKNQQSTAVFLHLFLTLKHSSIVLSRKNFAAVGVIEVKLNATHWTWEKQNYQKIISQLRSTQQRRKIYCETPFKSWLIQASKRKLRIPILWLENYPHIYNRFDQVIEEFIQIGTEYACPGNKMFLQVTNFFSAEWKLGSIEVQSC